MAGVSSLGIGRVTPRVEEVRIRKAQEIIPPIPDVLERVLDEHGDGCAVSWSGGKCSTVVLHQVLQMKPDVKVLFCNTGVEYPETYAFINRIRRDWSLRDFIETKPKKTFWECWRQYGPPMTRSALWKLNKSGVPKCCIYLKEKPAIQAIREREISCVITGLRASESRMRFLSIRRKGQYFESKKWGCHRCHPLAFWGRRDLLHYIEENDLPINCIYQKVDRCGCQPCTAFVGWEKQLAVTNPALYEYIQKLLGQTLITGF